MKKLFKLYPCSKDYIWGGTKLKKEYGKVSDKDIIAETWELSFHKDGPTKIQNGKLLKECVKWSDLGTNVKNFKFFPTLIKFIDALDNLSIQVHPSDEYALKNENSFGKTEMWYIVDAEKGAGIYLGFNKDVTKEQFSDAIKNKTLTDLLNFYEVKKGDCYFIPSGTIHAIAKGCLICEIQQNSNLTYRVYDYGRKDKFGKERELHVEKALKVTNTNKLINSPLNIKWGEENILGISKYFTVSKVDIKKAYTLAVGKDSFLSINCVSGSGEIKYNRGTKKIEKGNSFFLPASAGKLKITGDLTVILTRIKKYHLKENGNNLSIVNNSGFTVATDKKENRNTLLSLLKITDNDLD